MGRPQQPASQITLRSGETLVGQDFGQTPLTDASIHGTVFSDVNKNGTRDAGEKGIAGITVYLDLNNNAVLDAGEASTQTLTNFYYTPAVDEAGNYSFTHLASGSYHVAHDHACRIESPRWLAQL